MPGAAPETSIRMLLAGDRRLFVEALQDLLAADPRFEIVGVALDSAQALELAGELMPDVVLLDAAGPELANRETIRRLTETEPAPRVLMLRGSDMELDTVEAHVAGAAAFLRTPDSAADLLDTLQLAVLLLKAMGPPPGETAPRRRE